MGNTIAGSQAESFDARGRDTSSVSISKYRGGSLIITGLTADDDSVQIREMEESITFTKGAYSAVAMNLNSNAMGEVIIKLLEAHDDNSFMADWFSELRAGSVNSATIIITTAKFKHQAFNCVPVKFGDSTPLSAEDPGVEWRILAGSVSMWEKLNQDTSGDGFTFSLSI